MGVSVMRLIAYCRASTTKQETTIETQESRIRAYCEAMGHSLSHVISEHATSKNLHRDGLTRALEGLNEADGLIVYSVDRLSRSVRDVWRVLEEELNGKDLIFVREGLDTTTPTGRFCLTLMAAAAQLERELISERTSQALETRKASGGRWCKNPPYGYRWEGTDSKGKGGVLAVEPDEQVIAAWAESQESISGAAKALNESGRTTRTGRKWTRTSLWKALRSFRSVDPSICEP